MATPERFVSPAVADIMEKHLRAYPEVFEGFDVNEIVCFHYKGKEDTRRPLKIKPVRDPFDMLVDKVYIIQVADATWNEMTPTQRHLAVFHTMCAIPEGAFDKESREYGKVKKPDYELFAEEFAAAGGVPNWMENPEAKDPLEKKKSSTPKRAVTTAGVAAGATA